MLGRSRCKTGLPDLQEFAAARSQNLYAHRSSTLASLYVTLMHAECVSAQLMRGVDILQRPANHGCCRYMVF
jgi:hypothetical protein